jgi:WD40 repeat protein
MPKKGDTDEYIYAVLQGNSEQKDKILEPIISINQINYSNDINVIAELSSTTLITGSDKGIISALRLDYKTRKFSIFCQKKKAHDDTITSFGVLNKTNILSSSCDTTIKQWELDSQQLTLIHVYKGHTDYVRKILILDTNIFASCSRDGNIYIWNSNKGRTVANLQEQGDICSIIQLQHSKLIVSSCLTQRSISFWNIGLQQQMYRMKNIYTFSPNGMIQLENQNIAIASYNSPYNLKISLNEGILNQSNKRLDIDNFRYKFSALFWNCIWYFFLNRLDYSFILPYEDNVQKVALKANLEIVSRQKARVHKIEHNMKNSN